MKQYSNTESFRNLDRYVAEELKYPYTSGRYDALLSELWKDYMSLLGINVKDVARKYEELGIDKRSIFEFEYFTGEENLHPNIFILWKKNVARILERKDGKPSVNGEPGMWASQYISLTNYANTFSSKVFNNLLFEKFPYMDDPEFYEEKEIERNKVSLSEKANDFDWGDMTIEDVVSMGIHMFSQRFMQEKERVRANISMWSVYFGYNKSGTDIFLKTKTGGEGSLSIPVPLECLINKDFEGIIEKDKKVNERFLRKMSNEKKEARYNEPQVLHLKEILNS